MYKDEKEGNMIDFHSHILPGIDDGSRSLETSLEMLRLSRKQGVDCIVATPHFYAMKDRTQEFFERRGTAYQAVFEKINTDEYPRIVLGAEVAYFEGVSEAEAIDDFTIGDTNWLLLELPFSKWNRRIYEELERLTEDRNIHIILAHLERYFPIEEKKDIQRILDFPVTVQINAGSLLDWKKRSKIVKMFKHNKAHLLGSDCHGMHHRPPNLLQGRDMLEKKAGREVLDRIDALGEKILL